MVSKLRRSCSALLASLLCITVACSDAGDLVGLAFDPPSRKPIDQSKVGVNSFFVESGFGSISEQYRDISQTLGLRYVRVLFTWSDGVQPTPSSARNYSFYDQIIAQIPPGVDVVIVLAHTPSWITDSNNWIGGNPRTTFVEEWVKPTVARYAGRPGIIGWEVWNEPDFTVVSSDAALGLEDPDNYFELLNTAAPAIRNIDPTRLVLNAATRSIQQNFPTNLNYNKRLVELGANFLVDVWNVHYYGSRYESVVTSNGVADFLNGLGKPVWITESGEQGPNNQLAYAEVAWPFLIEKVPSIDRIYIYEYASNAPLSENWGLRTGDESFPVSDLYVNLRDN